VPPPQTLSFTGHAIVSADGMIADAGGQMPEALRNEADWQRFQAALDRSALVVLGRIGHQRHPNPGRRRLVLTRSVPRLAAVPGEPLVHLWNPAGAGIDDVLRELGITAGTVAVTGGTGTFDHFLPHYRNFELAEVHRVVLPGGTPCFSTGHPRVVLAKAGLRPEVEEQIAAGISLTHWRRPTPGA
jgi:hypothetical protein